MSARGGKFFRPGGKFFRPDQQENYEEESSEEEEEEEEDEDDEPAKSSSSRPTGTNKANNNANNGSASANANLSSDEEEEDDDEEEEEEEDDEEEEEEDDDEPPARKRKAAGRSSGNNSRGSGATAGKAKKKVKTSSFFDEEAEASEDDDEEDIDEPFGTHHDPHDIVKKHYTEEDIRREQMDEETRELIRQQDRRRQQAGRFLGGRGEDDDDDESVVRLAQSIEDRHRMQRRTVDRSFLNRRPPVRTINSIHSRPAGGAAASDEASVGGRESAGGGGGGDGATAGLVNAPFTAVSQQSLVPSVSDPSMWMVNCLNGKEEEMVYQLMNKCIANARQGRPVGITGCVAAQSKGRIYVESYSEPAVLEAIQGVRGLLPYSMRLIPIQDMTTVMTVVQKKKPVKRNDWVRLTRGHYKGDLGLVISVQESGLKCIVQCVPRLDLTLSDLPPEQARIRRRTVRPPQKFFNQQELASLEKQSLRQRFPGLDIFCDFFENNYYHEGYLLKEMTVGSMVKPVTEDDPPTLDELQRFRLSQKNRDSGYDEHKEENAGSKLAASLLDELSELQGRTGLSAAKKSTGGGLLIGDTVEVIEGDLVGLQGKIISLDGTTVKVKPTNKNIDLGGTSEVEFLANQVRKYIAVGVHVKVTDGRYANETGTVVAVEQMEGDTDCTAVVLTDLTNNQISVRTSQLRESAEVAAGLDKLADYELYDLVVLSGGGSTNEVGVIVRVGREDFTIVNNHGIVREVRPEELRGKKNANSNRALAVDVQGNQIRVGNQVTVTDGPHKGKQATIKRMSRTQLFLYSQTRMENAGIFVVRSRSVLLSGSRGQSRGGGADGGVSPFSTPRSQGGGGGAAAGRGKRDDPLIGKSVRIQSGQWKGYIGTVCDATATHVQVELHSRLKKVMVVRERVAVAGDKFGSTEDHNRNAAAPTNNPIAQATPFMGGATPMHGGATPMHGGATPMHGDSGMGGGDEVWRPGGAVDQDANDDDDNGGWGSSSDQANPFGTSENTDNGGWGSTTGASTWTVSTSDDNHYSKKVPGVKEEHFDDSTAIKREESAMETDEGDETAVWFMERVCVQLKDDSTTAVIKEITNKTAVVELENGTTRTVRATEVSMVPPKEHDTVLVTGGADVGVEGELVCIDGNDAILKDTNDDFKIVDFVHVAKIVADS